MSAHCLSASAESRLVASVDAEDDALVDLGEETVFAEAFKEAGGAAVGSGTRAVGSTDLAPGTHRRKVVDEAVVWDAKRPGGGMAAPVRSRNPLSGGQITRFGIGSGVSCRATDFVHGRACRWAAFERS